MSTVQQLKQKMGLVEAPPVKPESADVLPISKKQPSGNGDDLSALFKKADAAGGQAAKDDAKASKDQQANAVRDAVREVRVIQNEHGNMFILTAIKGQKLAYPINSDAAVDDIALSIKEKTNTAVSKDTIIRELGPIKGEVRRKGIKHRTAIRCAKHGDGYLVDSGNDAGSVFKVTRDGVSIESPPDDIIFLRPPGFGGHPVPRTFDTAADAVRSLVEWITSRGVDDVTAVVTAAVLVEHLRPDTPHPILNIIGEAGSGKSELARNMVNLIDPTTTGNLADMSPDIRSFAAASHSRYVFSMDNKRALDAETQDTICKTSTGADFVERELYSQNSTAVAHLHNPVYITAVTNPITAPDAASRAIAVHVKRPVSYKSTERLRDEFEAKRQELLGALLTVLSGALRHLPTVAGQRQWRHRLVSFAQLGEAIFQAAGHPPGYFLERFETVQRRAARESAGGDTFVTEVKALLRSSIRSAEASSKLPAFGRWGESGGKGWAAVQRPEDDVFLVAFKVAALFAQLPRKAYMPETERQLGDYIIRAAPVLRAIGIECQKKEARSKRTVWAFMFSAEALDD